MSDEFPYDQALEVAKKLLMLLRPFTCRIAIAGSLRRRKPKVGDIELLFIPQYTFEKHDLLEDTKVDLADREIEKLHKAGLLGKRLNVKGHVSAWGPKNKFAIDIPSGIPVDLFSTTPENWFVSLVIRTGSKETNLRLTTGAQRSNRTLNAYGEGITTRTGEKIRALSEEDVFHLCNVPYLEPQER